MRTLSLDIESMVWRHPPVNAAARSLGITTADIKAMTQLESSFAWQVRTWNRRRLTVGAIDLLWNSL